MAENSVPKIGPTSVNGPLTVRPGVGGGTSLSMQRRAHDSRFATRYFVGHGIDVGGGAVIATIGDLLRFSGAPL